MDVHAKKLAVLIDADNSSKNSISLILEEVAKYGIASVKRVYGDWSSDALKSWREVLLPHAITPVQQFAYTTGKDATDMILIIDAMDLLYSGALDGFCIVSSDSDFTPLASRIRESGLMVYGFGRKKTPEPFKKACDKFISVENLTVDEKDELKQNPFLKKEVDSKEVVKAGSVEKEEIKQQIDKATLNLIYKAVKDNSDDSGWAYLGAIGTYISAVKPDFDTRNYGYDKLSGLVKALGVFEIKMQGSQMYLRKSSFSTFIRLVQKAINQSADKNNWANIQDVINFLKQSDLNVRNYEEALDSIHNGWIESKQVGDTKFIRVNKVMP
ncbi:NYN domain-containing protein [Acinetobacter sp. GSS19]|uniref:NYN domain-containing protein n=1 Tax=Acinetobacter sp. GSS19 TaxID=3020716 RepID=UPI002362069A|nr:NYN domain-containing protein [Acinetobacter sp. GSS19]